MKTNTKPFGIIALAAVIGFSTIACGDGGGNNNNNNSNNPSGNNGTPIIGAAILNISNEQVYYWDGTLDDDTWYDNIPKLTGNWTIDDGGIGGNGSITNGKLSYSIGTPNINLASINGFLTGIDNVSVSDPSAQYSVLEVEGFSVQNPNDPYSYWCLTKENTNEVVKGNTCTEYEAALLYLYVDKDVTITANGYTEPYNHTNPNTVYSGTHTVKAIHLALKAGWNTVFYLEEGTSTLVGGTWDNPTAFNEVWTVTISLSNPTSLKWVLFPAKVD